MEPNQDIRITKTRKALAETLVSLLARKKFHKITVNDICQEAMVSRSTFYLHFEDKYQLLRFCIQMEHDHLKKIAQHLGIKKFLQTMLSAVKEREYIYRNLIMTDVNLELIRMFQSQFHSYFVDFLKETEKQGVEHAGPIPLLAVYYSDGLSGMLLWWIENNFQYSVEEMVNCHYRLLSDLLANVLPE